MIELGANAWYFLKVLGVVFHTYSSPSEADHRAKTRNCGNELCRHNSATRAAFPPTARILRADFETGCFNRFLRQLYRLLSIRRSTPSAQRSGPRVTFDAPRGRLPLIRAPAASAIWSCPHGPIPRVLSGRRFSRALRRRHAWRLGLVADRRRMRNAADSEGPSRRALGPRVGGAFAFDVGVCPTLT